MVVLKEKMSIPSVVIEPASSNEGDDDRDTDIISPTVSTGSSVTASTSGVQHITPSDGTLPHDFLYKVLAGAFDQIQLKPALIFFILLLFVKHFYL